MPELGWIETSDVVSIACETDTDAILDDDTVTDAASACEIDTLDVVLAEPETDDTDAIVAAESETRDCVVDADEAELIPTSTSEISPIVSPACEMVLIDDADVDGRLDERSHTARPVCTTHETLDPVRMYTPGVAATRRAERSAAARPVTM
jgi:hypothetical protein